MNNILSFRYKNAIFIVHNRHKQRQQVNKNLANVGHLRTKVLPSVFSLMPCCFTVCTAPDLRDYIMWPILLLRNSSAILCFPELKTNVSGEKERQLQLRKLTLPVRSWGKQNKSPYVLLHHQGSSLRNVVRSEQYLHEHQQFTIFPKYRE